jgi:hypothetical protein
VSGNRGVELELTNGHYLRRNFSAAISTAKRDKMATIRILVSFREVVKGLNFGWPEPATPADEH